MRISDWSSDVCSSDLHTAFQADIVDEAGRHTRVDAKVFGVYPLVPDPDFVLNEGAAEIMIDGVPGSGWLEFGWPRPYLEHVRRVGIYRCTDEAFIVLRLSRVPSFQLVGASCRERGCQYV